MKPVPFTQLAPWRGLLEDEAALRDPRLQAFLMAHAGVADPRSDGVFAGGAPAVPYLQEMAQPVRSQDPALAEGPPVPSAVPPGAAAAGAPMSRAAAPAPDLSAAAVGSGDSRAMLGLKGFIGNLHNGPVGAIAGGLGAAITGQPTDAGTIAAQRQNLTVRALLARGVSPQDIAAALHNPDVMKQLIAAIYGARSRTRPPSFARVTPQPPTD